MNKFYAFLLCLFFAIESFGSLNKTELRSAAFLPMGGKFKEVYGTWGPSIQVEQSRSFQGVKYFELWGNAEWIFMDGGPGHSCGTSSIDLLNLSVGVKAIGPLYRKRLFVYAGVGPVLGIVFITNRYHCSDTQEIKASSTNVGGGAILKTGCQIFMTPYVFLDLFTDYTYLPVHVSSFEDVGGFKFGGGLGGKY
jgi:hypothetical protein